MTFEIEVILPALLKFASVSVIVGSLTSLSTQGAKAMLNMEVSGNFARIITVLMAMFYSVLTVFYIADGTMLDAIIVFVISLCGASGIYDWLTNRGKSPSETEV